LFFIKEIRNKILKLAAHPKFMWISAPTTMVQYFIMTLYVARSNEILGWEGVGNRQLLCFFKA
jgi:hypothetical protein